MRLSRQESRLQERGIIVKALRPKALDHIRSARHLTILCCPLCLIQHLHVIHNRKLWVFFFNLGNED